MADALFDIKHPQVNYISSLLYSIVFFGGSYKENKIKLLEIYKVLKKVC